MKQRITARLRSEKGESISEVLVALLISALALIMLVTMVQRSTLLVQNSARTMDRYIGAENNLAEPNGDGTPGSVTVKRGDETILLYDGAESAIPVAYYENSTVSGAQVIAYRVNRAG